MSRRSWPAGPAGARSRRCSTPDRASCAWARDELAAPADARRSWPRRPATPSTPTTPTPPSSRRSGQAVHRARLHRRPGPGARLRIGQLHRLRARRRRRSPGSSSTRSPPRSPPPCTRDADHRHESFAEHPRPGGQLRPGDRQRPVRHGRAARPRATTRAGHSIHNHFIIKSLHLTRPGGLVAVRDLPVHDGRPQPRRPPRDRRPGRPGRRGPAAQPARTSGPPAPRVVTDLLILRRREPGRDPRRHRLGADPA